MLKDTHSWFNLNSDIATISIFTFHFASSSSSSAISMNARTHNLQQ